MGDSDEEILISSEHRQHRYPRILNQSWDGDGARCCCFAQSTPLEEYRPLNKRRVALVLILLCHFGTWVAGSTMAIWFPKIVDTR